MRVLARGHVDDHVDGGREALVPLLAQQVVVGGGEEALRRHRSQQRAQGAGAQQGPGAGIDALARDVDHGDLERLAVVGQRGDHEVAAEGRAARRLEHRLVAPTLRQRRQPALLAQGVPQVEQHRLAAQTQTTHLLPSPGHPGRHDAADGDDDQRHEPGVGVAQGGDLDAGVDRDGHEQHPDPPRLSVRALIMIGRSRIEIGTLLAPNTRDARPIRSTDSSRPDQRRTLGLESPARLGPCRSPVNGALPPHDQRSLSVATDTAGES